MAKYREDLNEAESDPVLDESQENIGGWYYCGYVLFYVLYVLYVFYVYARPHTEKITLYFSIIGVIIFPNRLCKIN